MSSVVAKTAERELDGEPVVAADNGVVDLEDSPSYFPTEARYGKSASSK